MIQRLCCILWLLLANEATGADEALGNSVVTEQLEALANDVRQHATKQQHDDASLTGSTHTSKQKWRLSTQGLGSFVQAPGGRHHQREATSFLGRDEDEPTSFNRKLNPRRASSSSEAQQKPDKNSAFKEFVGVCVFGMCTLILVAWLANIVRIVHGDYAKAKKNIDDLDWTFHDYLMYVFGYWLSASGKRSNASLLVLMTLAFAMLLVGTFAYWRLVPHASIWHGAWISYVWLTAPDGGIGERTIGGALCGAGTSLCGLLIFALLLTLLNDLFQGYMDRLRDGNDGVMEVAHIVVIGLTESKIHLLDELCSAYEHGGGVAIVILLGGVPKQEMHDIIDEADVDLRGSRIILRTGHPQYESDLERAGAHTCRSVIIMADHRKDKEVRDAFVLQTLLVLRSNGWPNDGHILMECSLLRNKKSLEKIGGSHSDIVMTERWLSRLFLQVSQQSGLGVIIAETFSFDGATLYIQPLPPMLVGKPFQELAYHYPDAIPIGTMSHNTTRSVLGNTPRKILKSDEDVIFIAHNQAGASNATAEKFCEPEFRQARTRALDPCLLGGEPEIIIVVGWSLLIGPMLVQVDKEVFPGTRVVCMSPMAVHEREQILKRAERRWAHKLTNITLEHVEGMLGSPTVWDRLPMPLEDASRIFILADSAAADKRHADACTVAALIQVRHILSEKNITKQIPIVPEIQDPRTEKLCKICNVSSYVDSSGMPVQVLAAVSFEPRLRKVLRDLVGDDGKVGYLIRGLQDYLPDGDELPEEVSFMDIHAIIAQTQDVVVGWSFEEEKDGDDEFRVSMADYEGDSGQVKWDMNPADKTTKRKWSKDDKICILGPHNDRSDHSGDLPEEDEDAVMRKKSTVNAIKNS